MEELNPAASNQIENEKVSSDGAARADDSRRISTREPQSSPPHKARRVDYRGHQTRPKKGHAKRARKEKALAEAAHMCQYYVDDHGLRRVRPYIYDFNTHTKERWLEKTVIDVFSKEFGANPRSYYERAIRAGLLTVNRKAVSPDYKLKNGDLVCNRTHRHEPPVAGGDIVIISESANEIVVDKPCTVPVHPCGAYRFNTLFYILQRQRPDLSLRICHRLDRLTSGLTILAKTAARANEIQQQIGSGGTRKTYLARVAGDFGEHLPAERRQPGSSTTLAAALPVPLAELKPARGGGADGDGEPIHASAGSALGSTGGDGVLSEGNGVDVEMTPVGGESNPSTVPISGALSTASAGGADAAESATSEVLDNAGNLWWRHESSFHEVVEAVGDGIKCGSGVVGAAQEGGGVGDGVAESSDVGKECSTKNGQRQETVVRVNCPIRVLDPKDGVYECHPDGKEAQTSIRKVAYDCVSDTSVVECTPVHGRTHQIRLHLQWIGHPIANDPCYGGELHFGDPEAKRRSAEDTSTRGWKGTSRDRAEVAAASAASPATAQGMPNAEALKAGGEGARIEARENMEETATVEGKCDRDGDGEIGGSQHQTPETASNIVDGCGGTGGDAASIGQSAGEGVAGDVEVQRDGEGDDAFMARICPLCQGGERFTETQLHCLGIWLHAHRYQGPDWVFESKMPAWAIF